MDSEVDSRFGRCAYFIIMDTDTHEHYTVENTGRKAEEGAGIQAAQLLVNEGVEAIIGSNMGPNAFLSLNYLNISLYSGSGKISDVMDQFIQGKLKKINAATVPKKSGQFTRK
ncbi:MAG: NifB/NifX family molybdenum-iron cluster-binding protein [Theionarchaea archaeon]|nr:NifB/NifX family molybdenum-iron cluster-binding protein [Theionarchaea archaeon]